MKLLIFIMLIALFFLWMGLAILREKREFNDGKCRCCGEMLRHFDTDSQGGRLYTCKHFHTLVSVSFNCVDRNFKEEL